MTSTDRSTAADVANEPSPLVLDGVVPYPDDVAARYRADGHWIDRTHSEMLFDTVAQRPNHVAVIAGDARITYEMLGERILTFAAGFDALGVQRGDRVVLHLPNIADYPTVLFALYEIGAVPVLALAGLRRHEIDHIVRTTGASVYVTIDEHDGNDLSALAADLRESVPTLERTVVIGADGTSADAEFLLSQGRIDHRRRSLPSDVAFLQLSGGTTGLPKIVAHTHEANLANVRGAIRTCRFGPDTVQLVVLPLSHSFAMRSPGFLGVFTVGGTIVLAPNGSPDVAFPLIEEHGITDVSMVPPLALAWLNSSAKERFDLTSLRVMCVGGAKFGPSAASRVRTELGATPQQSFGMSEGLATHTGLDEDDETITTRQGRPNSPADEIRVVDDDGNDVPVGSPGHLLTRGPCTIRGYYRSPEQDALAFTPDGFYRTGDIVTVDPKGYLTVTGRSKDQINRGGDKVAPEEVENLLLAYDAVHDASVVGIPDPMLGERTKAYLVPREGTDVALLKLPKVRQFLRGRGLADYKLPDVVEVVAEFERTAVGKVSKVRQRER